MGSQGSYPDAYNLMAIIRILVINPTLKALLVFVVLAVVASASRRFPREDFLLGFNSSSFIFVVFFSALEAPVISSWVDIQLKA